MTPIGGYFHQRARQSDRMVRSVCNEIKNRKGGMRADVHEVAAAQAQADNLNSKAWRVEIKTIKTRQGGITLWSASPLLPH